MREKTNARAQFEREKKAAAKKWKQLKIDEEKKKKGGKLEEERRKIKNTSEEVMKLKYGLSEDDPVHNLPAEGRKRLAELKRWVAKELRTSKGGGQALVEVH